MEPALLPETERTGWPWEQQRGQLGIISPDRNAYPIITIVTPSFNQKEYVEETIRSVLLQSYPRLEYIIVDGGSTDGSIEIIEKYSSWLHSWNTGQDAGQSDAINQGFDRGSGEILGWLNSDDTYSPGTLLDVARVFNENPLVDVVYGNANLIDKNSVVIRELHDVPFNKWAYVFGGMNLHQASVFWRRDLFYRVGKLKTDLQYAMDYELFMRFIDAGARFYHINKCLANFRLHTGGKTVGSPGSHSLEAIQSKRLVIKEPGFLYSCAHFAFQVRRLFWLLWQKDFEYVFGGGLSRIARQNLWKASNYQ